MDGGACRNQPMCGEFLQSFKEEGTVHQGVRFENWKRGAVDGECRNHPTYGFDFIETTGLVGFDICFLMDRPPDTEAMIVRPAAAGEVL